MSRCLVGIASQMAQNLSKGLLGRAIMWQRMEFSRKERRVPLLWEPLQKSSKQRL